MIEMENQTSGNDEGLDMLADIIGVLAAKAERKTYEKGYACGYDAGKEDRKTTSTTKAAVEAYNRGHEDGYDEACMDLTDDDLGSKLNGDCDGCFGASFNDCDKCRRMASKDVPQAEKSRCMTPEEFAETMKEIAESEDPECAHGDMDDLMCQLLEDLGYEEGVKIFLDAEKWYA